MMRQGTAAALALALTAAGLGAQGSQSCSFSSDGSPTINAASTAIAKFNATTDRAEQMTHVKAAFKALSDPAAKGDAVLRNWMLGQALVAYAMVEDAPLRTTRGELGFQGNAGQQIDVLLAADSAFTAVETAKPCASKQTDQMRSIAVARAMNTAIAEFNAGNRPQAVELSQTAIAIDSSLAPAYHLIGNAAVQERDYDRALEYLGKAVELAGRDSMYTDIRSSSLGNLAALAQNKAESLQGAEQQAMAKRAADYYRQHLEANPNDASARAGLARALQLTGDTAAVAGIYAEMRANPEKYEANQLIEAGITAINDGRFEDAVGVLEAAQQRNPYLREGLFALAIAQSRTGKYEAMLPIAHRLVAVDPANPDSYNLLAQAYSGMSEGATDKKIKRAYADSLLKTQLAASKLPVKVSFRGIEARGDARNIVGDIENRTAAPKTYVLKFEMLDAQGNVVGTEETTVADVAANGSSPFSVPFAANAVAYRYAAPQ